MRTRAVIAKIVHNKTYRVVGFESDRSMNIIFLFIEITVNKMLAFNYTYKLYNIIIINNYILGVNVEQCVPINNNNNNRRSAFIKTYCINKLRGMSFYLIRRANAFS